MNKQQRFFVTAAAICPILILGAAVPARAQQDYMPPMSGWPTDIQTQWQVQGEYYGVQKQDTTKHLGAWLVANGGTSYGLVILPGGLLGLPGQPDSGWDKVTRYQGSSGPANGSLNGKVFNVSTSTGGYTSDSITGSGENRTMYVHNSSGTSYVLQRVKRHSPTLGLKMSAVEALPGGSGAVSLWDSATDQTDYATKWTTKDNPPSVKYNYLYRGAQTVANYGTMLLHIEFLSCFNPTATGQGRANSGVYLQSHYENQVLDSYGLSGAINEYGAIYEVNAPIVNAELPPQVTLQTYDIYFTPRTSGAWGDAAGAATFTTYANGVLVQNATPCLSVTTAGSTTPTALLPGPLYLQNHGNEVVFNNIWVVPNATVTSLPYSSILAAVLPVSVNPNIIRPLLHKTDFSKLGFVGDYDLTGRKILSNGKILSIQPMVQLHPLQP